MTKLTTAAAAKQAKVTEDQVRSWFADVLIRQDEKAETVEEACEAVLGVGRGPVFNVLRRYALSE